MRETLSRHYTKQDIGKLLVSNLSAANPSIVLDMGMGKGNLTKFALRRWSKAQFYGTDIDSGLVTHIAKQFPRVKYYQVDGLSNQFPKKVKLATGDVDVAICNPPYNSNVASSDYGDIFEQSGLSSLLNFKNVSSDIVFLAQNLRLLKSGGELGIILPDSVLTNQKYTSLRHDLLYNHHVKSIIELPDNVFKKTEAKAHILIIESNLINNSPSFLTISDSTGNCKEGILASKDDLIHRMDFKYLKYRSENSNDLKSPKLRDLEIDITRGNKTKLELQSLGVPYFHTTNINEKISPSGQIDKQLNTLRSVRAGDILLSRVGKRCLGRVRIIKDFEEFPFSDCLYRLRCSNKRDSQLLFNSLNSSHGQEWLKAVSHGTCSKVLSKNDLLEYRLTK